MEKLKELAQRKHVSLRQIMNETLRRGLTSQTPRATRSKPYRVATFSSPFRSGVDPMRLNPMVDELEVAHATARNHQE
jgi:hypothetical protein